MTGCWISYNVHYMFTIYSLYIHCMFTTCSPYIHYIFIIYSLYIHCILLYVHYMFTIYSLYIHYMFTVCSLHVHYTFTIYSLYVHYMFAICSLYVHYMFTTYSLHSLYVGLGALNSWWNNFQREIRLRFFTDRSHVKFMQFEMSWNLVHRYSEWNRTCFLLLLRWWRCLYLIKKSIPICHLFSNWFYFPHLVAMGLMSRKICV